MELIYNQRNIPRDQHRYGFRASSAVGCGWIAMYNALTLMGYRVDTPGLIRALERELPLLHGNTGTSFWGPVPLLRRWGFPVKTSIHPREFDTLARDADACILFYHWRSGFRLGAHFVALQHTEKGFLGYNTFRNSTGPDAYGPSLEVFLKEKHYRAPFLIALRRRPDTL